MKHSLTLLKVIGFCLLLSLNFIASGNNVSFQNLDLRNNNTGSQHIQIHFDISWENSWRVNTAPNNWDAVWVFAKYKYGTGPWKHASINYVNGAAWADGHIEASGATIVTPSDGKGVFIHRSSVGQGNASFSGNRLRWNYGQDGITVDNNLKIKLFAIEMVYVPTGGFWIGSNGSGAFEFNKTLISTANATQWPSSLGAHHQGGYPQGANSPNNAVWPNGYNAFYCMKYETSESQWVGFFNCLAASQKLLRDITQDTSTVVYHGKGDDTVSYRNTITIINNVAATAAPDRACGWLSFNDCTAYCDWAGLRPMSEMEYEKACRGPSNTVADEFPWGTATLQNWGQYNLNNVGTSSEGISNLGVSGNAHQDGMNNFSDNDGPLRCGIFAASATNANRVETGATYYGIMEMAGNVAERCITLARADGLRFLGTHGDGELASNGEHDSWDWPEISTSKGGEIRGAAFPHGYNRITISDRFFSSQEHYWRLSWRGFRCARSAP